MPINETVKYEYRCPICKQYFTVDESESFKERDCPQCGDTIIPEPPGLNKGPIIKLLLNTHQQRVLAVVMGYIFGMIGAHKFVLNYNLCGALTLAAALALAAIYPPLVLLIWGVAIVEATIYLMTPDARFEERYIRKRRYFF